MQLTSEQLQLLIGSKKAEKLSTRYALLNEYVWHMDLNKGLYITNLR